MIMSVVITLTQLYSTKALEEWSHLTFTANSNTEVEAPRKVDHKLSTQKAMICLKEIE